jgi:hypothetical protein
MAAPKSLRQRSKSRRGTGIGTVLIVAAALGVRGSPPYVSPDINPEAFGYWLGQWGLVLVLALIGSWLVWRKPKPEPREPDEKTSTTV